MEMSTYEIIYSWQAIFDDQKFTKMYCRKQVCLNFGLLCFDGLETPIHLSIFCAHSWFSQNLCNVVKKTSILAEISGNEP